MRKNKGITLIALVVTIIVLLILAGISISAVIGDNGVVAKAKISKEKSIIGEEKEIIHLSSEAVLIEQLGEYPLNVDLMRDEVKKLDENTLVYLENEKIVIKFTDTNHIYEIDGNGNIDVKEEIVVDGVARIGTIGYPTLQDAINAVPEDNTETMVYLLKSVNEDVTVIANKNVILDLQDFTVNNSNAETFNVLGKISIINGNITSAGEQAEKATINVAENANVILQNVNVTRGATTEWETISLYGNLEVNSSYIKNANSNIICSYTSSTNININGETELESSSTEMAMIYNSGICNINGGNYSVNTNFLSNSGVASINENVVIEGKSSSYVTLYNASNSTLEINGAEIKGISQAFKNDGKLIINTGTIHSTQKYTLYNNASLIVNGGSITSSNICPLYNNGSTVINGGTVEFLNETLSNGTSGTNYTAIKNLGTLEMYDGNVKSNKTGIDLRSGTVTINGGTIEGCSRTIEIYGGVFNMHNGLIKANPVSGYQSSALSANNTSTVNFYGGEINTLADIYISSNVTFNHYGGSIVGGKVSGSGTYNDLREN